MFRRTANDLGVYQVLSIISQYALSPVGADSVCNCQPVLDKEAYLIRQRHVQDVIRCIIEETSCGHRCSVFPDINTVFENIVKHPTLCLSGEEIYAVGDFIDSAQELRKLFALLPEPYVENNNDIRDILPEIDTSLLYLSQEIKKIMEEPGKVKENYPTVKALRDKAESKRRERTKAAQQYMRTNNSCMSEDMAVLRDGRIVLPVKTDSKGQIEGYVQGASSSGATVFMEPFHLVDLNNAVVMANQEIEIEIARLTSMLSSMVKDSETKLRILSSQVTLADNLYAFASWAKANNCCKVVIDDGYKCNLIKAKHPLLKEKCVPIDLKIDNNYKAVVLTGPNAGGKTVTMKTVGLFSLLNQMCGFVPAADGSSLTLFDNVYSDIGDDQSIENQLSTFSGHMKSIGFILRNLTDSSLVILDELGSGTDPQEGAALARSILEFCSKKALLTLTTSHHGVLKQYAYSSQDILNASMEFDEKTLEPTFKVISGLPGESHAIDTAKRMHLPKSVTNNAQKYLGKEAVKISSIIRGLEQKRKEADDTEKEIEKRLAQIKKKENYLVNEENRLKNVENRLKKEKLRDFDDFVKDSRKQLELLVKELREGEITKEKTKKVKDHILELEKQRNVLSSDIEQREKELDEQSYEELLQSEENVELKPGMDVLCGQYKREGTVVKKEKNGKWVVAIGPMKFTFKETELTVPRKTNEKRATYSLEGTAKATSPKISIDLRGFRLVDALDAIDNQIEACCVHGITTFSIIHGYGDGILSTGIHSHLKNNPIIADYFFAHPEDGGQGKTYVTLKD